MEAVDEAGTVFWCGRCGTVKFGPRADQYTDVPKLVERCRAFELELIQTGYNPLTRPGLAYWRSAGIAESINPPDRRPS